MQPPLKASSDRAAHLKRTSAAATAEARRLWRRVDLTRVAASWLDLLPRLLVVIAAAQLDAARTAEAYTAAALGQQDITKPTEGELDPWALVGTASDGRPLESLLMQPALTTLSALAAGTVRSRALGLGWTALDMICRTQVADAFRNADSVAGVNRRVTEYVRVLTPPSCSRCAILAGDGRAWNTAFRRHPGDDCISMPTTRDKGMDHRTDPMAYFESLSQAEQARIFTKAGAQAIRDGADIYAVVNARRRAAGMTGTVTNRLTRRGKDIRLDANQFAITGRRGRLRTVNVLGQDTYITLEGRPVRLPGGGSAPRMMPESIYAIARDQEHAIRLLRLHGYIWH
ncbi:hypothetical protein [Glycomyces artemisiae]|uniref:Phage Mu protein F like protein n=1 Tax=Glycomyces artemisiae TaxID=1076443 RepID=A0A2T0UF23_9ACTN|nr:hypothetical protein [Glycomyces artemisiae]PRY56448.1 hypothetical protein B0I28_10997 [Glycomyces artemisiae]